jgi:hypothetical protein
MLAVQTYLFSKRKIESLNAIIIESILSYILVGISSNVIKKHKAYF